MSIQNSFASSGDSEVGIEDFKQNFREKVRRHANDSVDFDLAERFEALQAQPLPPSSNTGGTYPLPPP